MSEQDNKNNPSAGAKPRASDYRIARPCGHETPVDRIEKRYARFALIADLGPCFYCKAEAAQVARAAFDRGALDGVVHPEA